MKKQVVLFNHEVIIQGETFQAGKTYVFKIKTIKRSFFSSQKGIFLYYGGKRLCYIDSFQNQYVETHFADWIDDKKILAKLVA